MVRKKERKKKKKKGKSGERSRRQRRLRRAPPGVAVPPDTGANYFHPGGGQGGGENAAILRRCVSRSRARKMERDSRGESRPTAFSPFSVAVADVVLVVGVVATGKGARGSAARNIFHISPQRRSTFQTEPIPLT